MSGEARVKSFIDRILRLKEEQDALAADIREVYAEAKGEGYNKTAMGEVVAYLRKVEKKGKPALDEKQADFDLYLGAYERASGTGENAPHAYARARDFQPPRTAGLSEIKAAYQAGAPISQDFAFENGSVYFVAFRGLGRVKIGVSRNPAERIAELERLVGDVADIVAIIPGNRQGEIAAHKHHADWCISGEWYRLCDDIERAIKDYTHTHEKFPSRAIARAVSQPEPAGSMGDEIPAANPEAKASEDNGRTSAIGGAPMTGEASRLDAGRTASATSERMDVTGGESAATIPDTDVPAFLLKKEAYVLRPNGQKPTDCGGYGSKHCASCERAGVAA